jgi:hypothetical protein
LVSPYRARQRLFIYQNKGNMPTPRSDETEEEFVERCIPIVIEDGTAEDGSQANAICHSMWDQEQEKKSVTTEQGLYLVRPHGKMIKKGRKVSIAKASDIGIGNQQWIVVERTKALGLATLGSPEAVSIEEFDKRFEEHRVTQRERQKWWDGKDELILYEVMEFEEFNPSRDVEIPDGVKSIIPIVNFKENGASVPEESLMTEQGKKVMVGAQSLEEMQNEISNAFRHSTVVEGLENTSNGASSYAWIAATYPHLGYLVADWEGEFYQVNFLKTDGDYTFASFNDWIPLEKIEEWIVKVKGLKLQAEIDALEQKKNEEKAGRRIRGDKVDILKTISEKFNGLMDTLKDLISFADYDDKKPQGLFKGKDDGEILSMGIKTLELADGRLGLVTWTTNAFKDREGEIFTTQSIEDLIDRYEDKEVKGDLKFWHIPGSKFGDILWQGMSGRFLVEVGVFDDTPVGEAFKDVFVNYPDGHPEISPEGWGTSHGYLYKSDDREDGIYEWFDKEETSVLPASAAANPYNPKMEVLNVNQKQKEALDKLLPADVVEAIETTGEGVTKTLEDQDVSFKSTEDVVEDAVEVEPAVEPEVEEPKSSGGPKDRVEDGETKEGEEEELVYVTYDDVKAGFEGFAEVLKTIVADVNEIKASLKTLAESDEAKIKEKVELTPKESFKSIGLSVLGKKETRVDGRTNLAKDVPDEADPKPVGGIPLIDNIKARNRDHGQRQA